MSPLTLPRRLRDFNRTCRDWAEYNIAQHEAGVYWITSEWKALDAEYCAVYAKLPRRLAKVMEYRELRALDYWEQTGQPEADEPHLLPNWLHVPDPLFTVTVASEDRATVLGMLISAVPSAADFWWIYETSHAMWQAIAGALVTMLLTGLLIDVEDTTEKEES